MSELRALMSTISLEDLTVGPDGRVQIANPVVAKRISDLKLMSVPEGGGTHTNESQCNSGNCDTR